MFDYPTTSASCCTGASVAITAMIAAGMSLLSFAVLSPHRVSANAKRGVMLSVLALMVGLFASSAKADGPFYNTATNSVSYGSVEEACAAANTFGRPRCGDQYAGFLSGLHRWSCRTRPFQGDPTCAGTAEIVLNPANCPPPNVLDTAAGLCRPPIPDCGGHGTYDSGTNRCSCEPEYYPSTHTQTGQPHCSPCPLPGYILGESPTYFSGQGDVPSEICLEPIDSVDGHGCSRETQRSIRQGTSYAAIATRWTGNSCTVQSGAPDVGPPDASPDNPNSPDDCLSAGMGYVTANGSTQCVQNGTDTNPVTTTTKGTATNSDGSKTVTTTTTTSTTNNTHTSSTSVTYNNGNTQGEGDKTETSETSAGAGGGTSGDKACGAPGQPACRVTITGGTGEGDVSSLNLPSVSGAFDGEAEKGLLGGPLSSFLSDARSKLEDAVMLPDLAPGSCQGLALWDGIVLDVCPMVETAREIVAWIFYAAALWFGWMQLQRAIDRGAA